MKGRNADFQIGPFAAVHYAWVNGAVTPSNSPTPVWMLAFGGAMIVVGLATYGYNIMSVIGNRLTMHSPSRGFSMELGASITTLLAAQYAIPTSTTMCIGTSPSHLRGPCLVKGHQQDGHCPGCLLYRRLENSGLTLQWDPRLVSVSSPLAGGRSTTVALPGSPSDGS